MSEESDLEIWCHGVIRGFKLIPYDNSLYANIIGFYNNKEVEYCIRQKKQKPTLESHAYYRGVILPACMNSEIFGGWKINTIHRYFVSEFLKDVTTVEIKGQIKLIETTLSTGDISKKRFGQFIDAVVNFMIENNIQVPQPKTQTDAPHT